MRHPMKLTLTFIPAFLAFTFVPGTVPALTVPAAAAVFYALLALLAKKLLEKFPQRQKTVIAALVLVSILLCFAWMVWRVRSAVANGMDSMQEVAGLIIGNRLLALLPFLAAAFGYWVVSEERTRREELEKWSKIWARVFEARAQRRDTDAVWDEIINDAKATIQDHVSMQRQALARSDMARAQEEARLAAEKRRLLDEAIKRRESDKRNRY